MRTALVYGIAPYFKKKLLRKWKVYFIPINLIKPRLAKSKNNTMGT